MQTLTQLNAFAAQPIAYTDYRNPHVTYDRAFSIDQKIVGLIGSTLSVHVTPGMGFTEIVNTVVTYSIDLSSVSGAVIAWPHPLQGNLVASTSANVYSMNGIETKSDWDLVKSPIVYLASLSNVSSVFSSNVSSSLGSKTWTTVLVAVAPTELTTAMNDNAYTSGNATTMTGTPTITSIVIPT